MSSTGPDDLLLEPGQPVVEREARCVRIRRVERPVALLGDVQLGPEHEAKALDPAEPRAQFLLRQRLRVRRALEVIERPQLAVEQAVAHEARVRRVPRVVVDVREREEPIERRLLGVERLPKLIRERGEDVALLLRQVDAERAVAPRLDPAPQVSPVASWPRGRAHGGARRRARTSRASPTTRPPSPRCAPGA